MTTNQAKPADTRPVAVRLIATDLDGTLLRSNLSVASRTRAALDAARAAGIVIVPVTARQPQGVRHIAEEAGFNAWALCSNGAHCVDLSSGEVLFEAHVEVAAQRALADVLVAEMPGVTFLSVRSGGDVYVAERGYTDLADFEDHKRDPRTMDVHTLEHVLAEPSLKFIIRHRDMAPATMLNKVRALGLDGFEVTHSGAPFVEVLADGVSKAWGLARLCKHLVIARDEVLAFGDAPNDVEMLAWAGRGVAVSNAAAETKLAADEYCGSNDEDGVAIVIEQLLADQGSATIDP